MYMAVNGGGAAGGTAFSAAIPGKDVCGKTGTAQRVFRMSNGRYGYNDNGVESQQGSFVGFCPVDDPEYTAIVVIWSKPSASNFFGASYAAPPFREIADKIYLVEIAARGGGVFISSELKSFFSFLIFL